MKLNLNIYIEYGTKINFHSETAYNRGLTNGTSVSSKYLSEMFRMY